MALVLALAAASWGGEKKLVRIWHTETEPQSVAAFQQIITDFEKLHPDISVRQEAMAWGDLEAKLTAGLAAGAPPEASHGQAVTCASFYAKGLLRDQEDIAAAIDPVHFGVIFVINIMIGTVTPPVGTIMYVVCALGRISISQFAREIWPFLIALVIALFLVTYVPFLSLWLPNLLMPTQ
jgi:hypothetical protein